MSSSEAHDDTKRESSAAGQPAGARSMHDNVETWEDCCVCEPEPRWQALAEELEQESSPSEQSSRPAEQARPAQG